MNRVEEIARAMRVYPEPMFLFGLAALARQDYDGLILDLIAADCLVQAEKTSQAKMEFR